MTAIVAFALNKTFRSSRKAPAIEAVRNLNLTVEKGERIAFIGPNGAGKSTSIKMFTGILHPTSGDLRVLGMRPDKQRKQLVSQIGVLFGQRSQLIPDLSARRALTLLGAIFAIDKRVLDSRIEEVAELLHARDLLDRPVKSLSLGQRMRCELAAVLLHNPQVLFLDEPTIGLDIEAKKSFRELISTLNADQGTTIFLTSHDTVDIEAVAKRVVVINHGQLVYENNVDVMRRKLLTTKRIELQFDRAVVLHDIDDIAVEQRSPRSALMHVDSAKHDVRAVVAKALEIEGVVDVAITNPPLEEVIAEIYSREQS